MSLTGQWRMKVESSLTPNPFLLTLIEDADGKLSGSISEQGGNNVQPIQKAAYENGKITWEMALRYLISTFHALFEADAGQDRLDGKVIVHGYTKTFAAIRETASATPELV